eukprot:6203918-Pleurochrysis_carterae.AAC.2
MERASKCRVTSTHTRFHKPGRSSSQRVALSRSHSLTLPTCCFANTRSSLTSIAECTPRSVQMDPAIVLSCRDRTTPVSAASLQVAASVAVANPFADVLVVEAADAADNSLAAA